MNASPIRLIPSLFEGTNAIALRAVFQRYAQPGIIVSDVKLEIDPGTLRRSVIVGYCRESEGRMTQQLNPADAKSYREHEFKRYEFRVRAPPGADYMDASMLISKLALIKDK